MSQPLQSPYDMNPQDVMNHHAKSFSWAARFLSTAARHDAALLYAFARTADDYADEERFGTLQQRLQHLNLMRWQATTVAPIVLSTLACKTGEMLRSHGIPDTILMCFMDSLLSDAGPRHIDSQQELLRFAYGVAGTVGQMMRPVLGASASADAYAIALGVAMQLTNIARDVVEDSERGRYYIPAQWGVDHHKLAAPQGPTQRTEAFAVVRRLLGLADDFYTYAQSGFETIPVRNRNAICIASVLYQAIGKKILKRGPEKFWLGRVSLGATEKSLLITRTLLKARTPVVTARDVWRSDLSHLVGTPGFPA